MTGPEHYAAAERHLQEAFACTEDQNYLSDWNQRQAQVHATLAAAAAVIAGAVSVMKPTELGEWRQATSPGHPAEVARLCGPT